MLDPATLTERQQKWFASVQATLETETGKTVAQWAALARACPETAHRKRLTWMKQTFGFGQNRALLILNTAFPPAVPWSSPAALAETLWRDPAARAIFDHVRQHARALPGLIEGQRKTFSAFSRTFQFAALKPAKHGALLGLAVPPTLDPRLQPAGKQSWSERLHSQTLLTGDPSTLPIATWLRAAWERS